MRKSTNQFGNHSLRVAFIHAPDPIYADTQNYGAKFMPVWAYTLGAHIPGDGRFDLSLHDCRFEPERDIAEADIFLFSGINQDCGNLERVRTDLKRRFPDALSIIGGPICWSFDQAGSIAQLDGFDHIFIGDGEDEIERLMDALSAGDTLYHIIKSPRRFPINEAKPFFRPMLDSTVGRYYGAVLEVSRGCPFLATFQGINEFIKSGLTMLDSDKIKPYRVAESPAHFECKVNDIIELGNEGGAGNLIICEVLKLHVR